jgi:hypothetical protein
MSWFILLATDGNRTRDLFLTMEALYLLSYSGGKKNNYQGIEPETFPQYCVDALPAELQQAEK